MKKKYHRSCRAIVIGTALATSLCANAEIIEYSFIDTASNNKKVDPLKKYINPSSKLTISVSGGLDRKVRATILSSDNSVVETVTSEKITALDKKTYSKGVFYAKDLLVNKPKDGNYTVKAEILDGSNFPVQTDNYDLVVDTIPPNVKDFYNTSLGNGVSGLLSASSVVASFENDLLYATVDESGSGIDSVKFYSLDSDSLANANPERYLTTASANFTSDEKNVYLGDITTVASRKKTNLFSQLAKLPNKTGDIFLQFSVTDKAGNIGYKRQSVVLDNQPVVPNVPFAVFNPNYKGNDVPGAPAKFNGYELYKAGMNVYENPAKYLYQVDSNNWIGNNTKTGWYFSGLWANTVISDPTKSDYTYENKEYKVLTISKSVAAPAEWVLMFKSTSYYNRGNLLLNVNIDPGIVGPFITGATCLWSDSSEFTSCQKLTNKPVTMTAVRMAVQARAYPQVVVTGGGCIVPVGQTTCIADVNYSRSSNGISETLAAVQVKNESGTLKASSTYGQIRYDSSIPQITSVELNNRDGTISADIRKQFYGFGAANITEVMFIFRSKSGQVTTASGRQVKAGNTGEYTYTSSLPSNLDGIYDVLVTSKDTYGNIDESNYGATTIDRTKPVITIKGSTSIKSLEDLAFFVTDTVDNAPSVTSIILSGGEANENINLAWNTKPDGSYALEYPVIFPSLEKGRSYKVTVEAKDHSGNIATAEHSFSYLPETVGLENDGFYLPAVGAYAWTHANGKYPFSSKPLTNYEGRTLTGNYALTGTLRSDSTAGPISINGVVLNPGETKTLGDYDFSANTGSLSLPIYPVNKGSHGFANILVSSGAPGAPMVVGSFNVWSPKIVVDQTNTNLKGKALIDSLYIGLNDESGKCTWRPKTDIESVTSVDIISEPTCFNTALDTGIEYYLNKNYATLYGRLPQITTKHISAGNVAGAKLKGTYRIGDLKKQALIDLDVNFGAMVLESTDPSGEIKFGEDNATTVLYRSIQSIDQNLVQTSGPTCSSITSNETEAIASGVKMNAQKGISSVACYFKWLSTPPGVDTGSDEQQGFHINGTVSQLGTFPIAWELVAYSPLGQSFPVTLSKQTMTVEVVNPPPPSIEVQSTRLIGDSLYTVQKKPTNIGTVNVTGLANGAVVYKVMRGGEVLADSSDKAEYAKKTASYRLNSDTQGSLWANQSYTLLASYVKLPDITASKEIRTITVPDDDMSMKVSTELSKALSSSSIPVTVGFYNKSNVNNTYNTADAGEWSVRLVDVKSAKNRVPLSSWTPVNSDGTVTIDLPLSLNAGDTLHLGSEGTLASQLDGFEMSKTSANTVTITVLDASPVEGELKSYKVSGVAPLAVSTSLVSNQKDLVSLVEWQISNDNGTSWKVIEGAPTAASKMLSNVYAVGIHHVRAKLTNKYSGVQSYTAMLQIQAYNVPDARYINGSTVMLMGQQGEMKVTNKDGNPLLDSAEVVYEWSTDRGETWQVSNEKYVFNHTSEIGNYPLWARVRYASSPVEDTYAYKIVKTAVSVRKTAKVTIGLVGSSQPEVNKSNLYKATVNLPYSNMQGQVMGRYTLPDGNTVDGFTLDYRPTVKPVGSEVITFDAWIAGYEVDSKRTVSKKLRAWEYAWPIFSLRPITDPTSYAPMTLDLRVESVGSLNRIEDLSYSWDLPESDTFISTPARLDTRRVAKISEPGTYPISVTISDSRGNTTVLKQDLVVSQSPPWVVDLAWNGSNSNNRATLDIRTKPQITRGHKYDSITGYTYKLNGTVVGSDSRYTNLSLKEPGEYVLSLDLTTELGFGGYGETKIDVVKNMPPECNFNVKQTSTAYVVTSKCTDPDGKMASYEWTINGEPQSIRGSSISISKRSYPAQPKIQLIGIDDSGGRSQPVQW
ncbi:MULTISPECIES: Ig-like domain-containing protein [Pseudomonas]|uniref:Ig-like domain-containing protein n=1 Tax=Pseudomonas TaxID=286 RepID=UPI001867E4A8|nr:Ig-like domain-containing protein [Pseudomonas lundensis]